MLFDNFEVRRFEAIKKFHDAARTKAQRAFAVIKCEPTWFQDGKRYMMFETAPDYVKDIDEALERLADLEEYDAN